jgi:hypothetical protein
MTTSQDGLDVGTEPVGLHDKLVAWQEGRLPYRSVLASTGMRTVTELYEAAANSGVEIRTTLLPNEQRAAMRAVNAIRAIHTMGSDSGTR